MPETCYKNIVKLSLSCSLSYLGLNTKAVSWPMLLLDMVCTCAAHHHKGIENPTKQGLGLR